MDDSVVIDFEARDKGLSAQIVALETKLKTLENQSHSTEHATTGLSHAHVEMRHVMGMLATVTGEHTHGLMEMYFAMRMMPGAMGMIAGAYLLVASSQKEMIEQRKKDRDSLIEYTDMVEKFEQAYGQATPYTSFGSQMHGEMIRLRDEIIRAKDAFEEFEKTTHSFGSSVVGLLEAPGDALLALVGEETEEEKEIKRRELRKKTIKELARQRRKLEPLERNDSKEQQAIVASEVAIYDITYRLGERNNTKDLDFLRKKRDLLKEPMLVAQKTTDMDRLSLEATKTREITEARAKLTLALSLYHELEAKSGGTLALDEGKKQRDRVEAATKALAAAKDIDVEKDKSLLNQISVQQAAEDRAKAAAQEVIDMEIEQDNQHARMRIEIATADKPGLAQFENLKQGAKEEIAARLKVGDIEGANLARAKEIAKEQRLLKTTEWALEKKQVSFVGFSQFYDQFASAINAVTPQEKEQLDVLREMLKALKAYLDIAANPLKSLPQQMTGDAYSPGKEGLDG